MSTATAALPSIPPEVREFAAAEGAAEYLAAVLEMTREVFPSSPIAVALDIDPEIPGDRHIRVEVDISRTNSVDDMLRLSERWTRGLLHVCPLTHAAIFRIGIV